MSATNNNELDWLATQYVLGELSELDCDEFELRLAEDLAACEAVARASRLRLALRDALGKSDTPIEVQAVIIPTSRRSQYAVGISIAAIACTLLVMAFGSRDPVDPTQPNVTKRSSGEAIELVSRWRSDENLIEDRNDSDEEDLADDAEENGADAAVPGWLVAGVLLENHGASNFNPDEFQED